MSLLDKASLIITPNAYKESILYSVVPSSGAGDMSVVRATTATRVNELGLIESVGTNIPRIDYTNGSCPSLLVEPQRTNLTLYSNNILTTYWITNGQTITNNNLSPDGTLNASFFNADAGAIYRTYNSTPNATITISCYVKLDTAINFCIIANDSVAWNTIGGKSFTSADGLNTLTYTKISYTFTIPSSGQFNIHLGTHSQTDVTPQSNGTVYFYGAQLEAGSYPTSYIPTVASAVTRNADVISKTGISSLIGQTEGTMFCEINTQVSADNNWFQILDGSADNWVLIGLSGNKIRAFIRFGGVTIFDSNTFILTNDVSYKAAITYKNGDLAFYINGVQIATSSISFTITNTISYFSIGYLLDSVTDAAKYKQGVIFKTRLSNTELSQLTSI